MFKRLAFTAALLASLITTAARADLVIEGRASQALHCAALLLIAASVAEAGDPAFARKAALVKYTAVQMLAEVPGTDAQKGIALQQRIERILKTRDAGQFVAEARRTQKWCLRNFL